MNGNQNIKKAFELLNEWEYEQIAKKLDKLPKVEQSPEKSEATLRECLAIIEKRTQEKGEQTPCPRP